MADGADVTCGARSTVSRGRSGRRAAIRIPGRDNSKDTVTGMDGKIYTSDQATIWRWRTAFQHDFAARMDWTIGRGTRRQSQS